MTPTPNRFIRQAVAIGLFAFAAVLGTVSGALFAYSPDLPEIAALDDYTPSTITRVFDRSGEEIGDFATQRRVIIGYDDIPEVLRHAIIAAEDKSFFEHSGISIPAIIRTAVNDVLRRQLHGASTLTMQLARNITVGGERLGLEKTPIRKLRETFYTFQLEKRYTKREIFTLYCNEMYLGTATHAAHGVEAASRLYFGKSARDLELGEAALIAGIFQLPSRQSPLVNMEWATQRRNYALGRMAAEGYITADQAAAAKLEPIQLAPRRERRNNTIAPYFLEEVRQHLEREYGAARLYEDGLVVRSTLDATLQVAANRAVSEGLRSLDKRHGYRGPRRNVLTGSDTVDSLDAFEHRRWIYPIEVGDVVPAIVTGIDSDTIQVRVASYSAAIDPEGYRWTRARSAEDIVERGDLIDVRIAALPETSDGIADVTLDQEPEVEASLLAIDNRTGHILAMVGGYDFERSKFNRATQAYRQLGSLFKGVLYAAAIDQGYTATSIVIDEPVSYDVGPDQDLYEPENYDNEYEGPITLRHALEKSRNVPAVWLMDSVGPDIVVDFARRVGFSSPVPPYLSVALGSAEATLAEVTSAYSVFPNGGTRMVPFRIQQILDRDGNVLEEHHPQSRDALRADTAYIMVSLMRGVVQRGTAQRARRELAWPVGGKTGTMDEYTDAWFVGFDPDITVGVWVGYDEKRTLGDNEEGARVALPIWIDFMKAYIDEQPAPEGFVPPGNIVFTTVDPKTGQVTEPWARDAIQEAFIAGTEPGTAFRR